MKTWGSGDIAPRVLIVGTTALLSLVKEPQYPFDRLSET